MTVIAIRTKFYVISLFGRLNNIVWRCCCFFLCSLLILRVCFVLCAAFGTLSHIILYCVFRGASQISPALFPFWAEYRLSFSRSPATIKRNNLNTCASYGRRSVDTKRHTFSQFHFIFTFLFFATIHAFVVDAIAFDVRSIVCALCVHRVHKYIAVALQIL